MIEEDGSVSVYVSSSPADTPSDSIMEGDSMQHSDRQSPKLPCDQHLPMGALSSPSQLRITTTITAKTPRVKHKIDNVCILISDAVKEDAMYVTHAALVVDAHRYDKMMFRPRTLESHFI